MAEPAIHDQLDVVGSGTDSIKVTVLVSPRVE
jgi:hypothetical protein